MRSRLSVHTPVANHHLTALLPWLAGAVAFVLYALTAAPSIVALFDDSLEFQLVLPTFAIAHPTGYPLYTLLGGVWSRLLWPLGNWASRVNLLSALAAAAAVGMVFALAQRLVDGERISQRNKNAGIQAGGEVAGRAAASLVAGAIAAITFGLGPVWSAQATLAEVYSLHNLLLASLLLATVGAPELVGRRLVWRIALLALIVGSGLAHHRTIVLALPGVGVYLLWSVPGLWRPRRAWWLWLAALLLPLLFYLYLPLRALAGATDLHGSYTNTWQGFWDHVLARGYAGFFTPSALSVERSLQQWLELMLAQVGWAGGCLAVFGFVYLLDARRRKRWVLVLLVLATNLLFALAYRVGDQEVFLLPVFMCLALLAGGGAAVILSMLQGHVTRSPAHLLTLLFTAALLALLIWGPGRGPLANRSSDWVVHDYAVDMATVDFPPRSVVLGLEGEVSALRYMQAAEGLGANAMPVAADDPARRADLLAESVAAAAPSYLTRELEGIGSLYSFSGDGPLVRVWPRGGSQVSAPQHTLEVDMAAGALRLTGYDLQQLHWAGGPALRINLYWQPATAMTQVFKTSIRLLGASGAPLTYADGAPAAFDQFPLRQVAPTTTWLPGETVRDAYAFYLPTGAPPATVQVILYDAETLAEAGRWETPLPAP